MKEERPVNADTDGIVGSSRIYSPGNFDSGLSNVAYPRSFKHTLGKHAQQFVGYDQHDSQELAIYLLDALHEDTNRITKKPYIEKPEQEEDESDRDAAEKAWSVHLQREDSKVFDYFMGQIKSRLQCTTKGCGRVSTTFDPSMYLSVPIPGSTDREMKVTFVPLDRTLTCANFTVKLCKNSTFAGLKKHVADLARECYGFKEGELLEEDIQITDLWQDKTFGYHSDDDHIDKVKDRDLTYVYQLYPLAAVKKEFAAYQEAQKKSVEANISCTDEETSPDFLLDGKSRAKLDEDGAWEKSLERYIPNHCMVLNRLLNKNRSNLKERTEFHEKLIRFITKCRKCPDCKLSDDDIIEEKSDKAEVESSLNPDETDGIDSSTSLAEICEMARSYQNVRTARDVGVLEYCAFKFKTFMRKVDESSKKVELNENGLIFDIALHKDGRRVGKPIVVRVPSTLTVHELRGMLATQLSGILKSHNGDANHSSGKTAIGGMSPQLSIMNQTAMSYDALKNSFSAESFGSVTEQLLNDASFAKPTEDEEKELIASAAPLGLDNTLHLKFPSRLNDYINDDYIMPEDWLSESQKVEKAKLQDNKVSVVDCIQKFCQPEQLDENDMWYCNKCKQHNQAWKECHLYRTPPILVIHLKRFHYSATTHRRDKIDTFIDFPLNDLDLREIVTEWKEGEEPIYDCYAVSNHFGGLGGGHYTAYARGDDNTWSNFDDSRVTSSVPESEVVSSAAYCLYYKRKDVVFESGKEFEDVQEAQVIQSDSAMVIGSPKARPQPIADDASSQAQMDVDDRSSNFSLDLDSEGNKNGWNWGSNHEEDHIYDEDNNVFPQVPPAQDDYPLQ